jgi:hypothetical protein
MADKIGEENWYYDSHIFLARIDFYLTHRLNARHYVDDWLLWDTHH